jgi:hypothetical protein
MPILKKKTRQFAKNREKSQIRGKTLQFAKNHVSKKSWKQEPITTDSDQTHLTAHLKRTSQMRRVRIELTTLGL